MQQLILAAIVENTTGSSLTTSTSWFPKRVAGFQSSIALGDQSGNPIELALGGSIWDSNRAYALGDQFGIPIELALGGSIWLITENPSKYPSWDKLTPIVEKTKRRLVLFSLDNLV